MPAAQPATDESLCAAVARGDEQALAELIGRWEARMYALLLRSTGTRPEADDLFQELWLRVVRAAPDFDPRLRFRTWLYRIAVNLTRDAARRRSAAGFAQLTRDGALPEHAGDGVRGPEELATGAQEAAALHRAIAELPPAQREVLVLRYLEELPEAEVAAAAGIPAGTVKSRLHHAVRTLRERLAGLREDA